MRPTLPESHNSKPEESIHHDLTILKKGSYIILLFSVLHGSTVSFMIYLFGMLLSTVVRFSSYSHSTIIYASKSATEELLEGAHSTTPV